MINKAIIGGRLTRDPEPSATVGGTEVSKFSVAIDRRYKKQGEEKQTDFLNVTAFGKTAEFVNKYFEKGKAIIVVGSIQSRSYEKDGQKRYVTEIIAEEVNFAGSKKDSTSEESSSVKEYPDSATEALEALRNHNGFTPVDDDELPF